MLFWIVLLAHHSLCSPISYSQAQVAKTSCIGTSLLVRDSNWCQRSESFSATLDFTHSQNAPLQRRQLSGKDTEKDSHNDRRMEKQPMASKCRMEMLYLSSDEQEERRILPIMWWLMGRMCPRARQWMDVGKRTPSITKETKCEQTEQTKRKFQRKVGQRQIWKTNRRIAIAIWTVHQCYSNLAMAPVRHLTLYQFSGQGDESDITKLHYNHAYSDDRFGDGAQESVPRWFRSTSWCQGSTGEVRSSRFATDYSRPTQCYYSTRQGTQGVERSCGSQKVATQQLDSTSTRIYRNVGISTRSISTFIEPTSRSRDESNCRHWAAQKAIQSLNKDAEFEAVEKEEPTAKQEKEEIDLQKQLHMALASSAAAIGITMEAAAEIVISDSEPPEGNHSAKRPRQPVLGEAAQPKAANTMWVMAVSLLVPEWKGDTQGQKKSALLELRPMRWNPLMQQAPIKVFRWPASSTWNDFMMMRLMKFNPTGISQFHQAPQLCRNMISCLHSQLVAKRATSVGTMSMRTFRIVFLMCYDFCLA